MLRHNVQSLRSSGSAALEISKLFNIYIFHISMIVIQCLGSVACGRFDVFYEFGVHPWDIAAGIHQSLYLLIFRYNYS